MQRIKGLKTIKIRKKAKSALPKKKPNLEKFYQPTQPFRHLAPPSGYNVIMAPMHGVSGYATTGTPSSFTVQDHTPPRTFADFTNVDPTTSSFTLQPHTTRQDVDTATNGFLTPAATNIVNDNAPTYVFNDSYMTPAIEERMEDAMTTSGLMNTRVLQSTQEPQQETFLRRRLYEGYLQNDPIVAGMVRDEDRSPLVGDTSHHVPNEEYRNGTTASVVYTSPRTNHHVTGGNGTENQSYNVIMSGNFVTPEGQSNLPDINNEHTPAVGYTDHATTATHTQEGGTVSLPASTSGSSASPQIAATIVPVNSTPYLSLGTPPQPQVQIQEGPGQIRDVTSRGVPFQTTHHQIQFQL